MIKPEVVLIDTKEWLRRTGNTPAFAALRASDVVAPLPMKRRERASKITTWSFPARSLRSIESNLTILLLNPQRQDKRVSLVVTDSTSVRGGHGLLQNWADLFESSEFCL